MKHRGTILSFIFVGLAVALLVVSGFSNHATADDSSSFQSLMQNWTGKPDVQDVQSDNGQASSILYQSAQQHPSNLLSVPFTDVLASDLENVGNMAIVSNKSTLEFEMDPHAIGYAAASTSAFGTDYQDAFNAFDIVFSADGLPKIDGYENYFDLNSPFVDVKDANGQDPRVTATDIHNNKYPQGSLNYLPINYGSNNYGSNQIFTNRNGRLTLNRKLTITVHLAQWGRLVGHDDASDMKQLNVKEQFVNTKAQGYYKIQMGTLNTHLTLSPTVKNIYVFSSPIKAKDGKVYSAIVTGTGTLPKDSIHARVNNGDATATDPNVATVNDDKEWLWLAQSSDKITGGSTVTVYEDGPSFGDHTIGSLTAEDISKLIASGKVDDSEIEEWVKDYLADPTSTTIDDLNGKIQEVKDEAEKVEEQDNETATFLEKYKDPNLQLNFSNNQNFMFASSYKDNYHVDATSAEATTTSMTVTATQTNKHDNQSIDDTGWYVYQDGHPGAGYYLGKSDLAPATDTNNFAGSPFDAIRNSSNGNHDTLTLTYNDNKNINNFSGKWHVVAITEDDYSEGWLFPKYYTAYSESSADFYVSALHPEKDPLSLDDKDSSLSLTSPIDDLPKGTTYNWKTVKKSDFGLPDVPVTQHTWDGDPRVSLVPYDYRQNGAEYQLEINSGSNHWYSNPVKINFENHAGLLNVPRQLTFTENGQAASMAKVIGGGYTADNPLKPHEDMSSPDNQVAFDTGASADNFALSVSLSPFAHTNETGDTNESYLVAQSNDGTNTSAARMALQLTNLMPAAKAQSDEIQLKDDGNPVQLLKTADNAGSLGYGNLDAKLWFQGASGAQTGDYTASLLWMAGTNAKISQAR